MKKGGKLDLCFLFQKKNSQKMLTRENNLDRLLLRPRFTQEEFLGGQGCGIVLNGVGRSDSLKCQQDVLQSCSEEEGATAGGLENRNVLQRTGATRNIGRSSVGSQTGCSVVWMLLCCLPASGMDGYQILASLFRAKRYRAMGRTWQ